MRSRVQIPTELSVDTEPVNIFKKHRPLLPNYQLNKVTKKTNEEIIKIVTNCKVMNGYSWLKCAVSD